MSISANSGWGRGAAGCSQSATLTAPLPSIFQQENRSAGSCIRPCGLVPREVAASLGREKEGVSRQLSFSHPQKAVQDTEEPFVPSAAKFTGRMAEIPPSSSSLRAAALWLLQSHALPSQEFLLGNTGHEGTSATSWLALHATVLCSGPSTDSCDLPPGGPQVAAPTQLRRNQLHLWGGGEGSARVEGVSRGFSFPALLGFQKCN